MAIHSQYVTGRKVEIRIHSHVYKDANIFSTYSLCSSVPIEVMTAALASAYVVSLLVEELVASPGIAVPYLATVLNPTPVAALASAYSLATAVT